MAGVLYDASVYINWLRQEESLQDFERAHPADQPIWLSAVTVEELIAGIRSSLDLVVLKKFTTRALKSKRIIVPALVDSWIG